MALIQNNIFMYLLLLVIIIISRRIRVQQKYCIATYFC